MNLVTELHAVTAALNAADIRYAVVGGLAVTMHGAVRTTKDIDLLVDEPDVPRILELMRPLGYIFAALPLTFEADTPRERRVQRVSKIADGEHLCVDLIICNAVFAGLLDDTVEVSVPGGTLRVISRAGLVKMKQLAGRDQDLADLARLEGEDG
ncbi:MAG: nucleotidyltransferase family protein [Enhygromyxa sp.]